MLAFNLYNQGLYSYATNPPFAPTASIPPGYPTFLYLHFATTTNLTTIFYAALTTQCILGSLTVVLLFRLALSALPYQYALIFSMIVALTPQFVVFTGYVLTETVFTFFFIASISAFFQGLKNQRISWMLLAGFLAGLATLTRPIVIFYLPLMGLLFLWLHKISVRKCLALLAVLFCSVLPWQLWSSQTAQAFPESRDYLSSVIAFGSYPDFIFKNPAMKGYPYREDPDFEIMNKSVVSAMRVILQRAQAEPARYLHWYTLGKPVTFWSWNMMESVGGPFIYEVGYNFWTHTSLGQAGLFLSHFLHRLLILSGFCVMMMLLYQIATRRTTLHKLPAALVLALAGVGYYTLLHMLLAAWPRYAVPAWPLFYLCGTYGIWYFIEWLKIYRTRVISTN